MARLAREENEALKARIAALEAKSEPRPVETKFAAGSGEGTSGQV
jgi:BMFP domain-containing protein YqiC